MSKSSEQVDGLALLHEKMVVLGLVNILQPVKVKRVVESLSKEFDARRLRSAVRALQRQGMLISIGRGQWLVSRRGRDALGTGHSAKERDISRMLYLIEGSKGGRETA